jgi:hypothetical protein
MRRRSAPSVVIWGKDIAFFASSMVEVLAPRGVEVVDLTGPYDEGRDPRYPDPLRLRVLERRLRAVEHRVGDGPATVRTLLRWAVGGPLRVAVRTVRSAADLATVLWMASRFDAAVFSWRTSVSGARYEPLVFRVGRCRTVLMLMGSEARPPYLNGAIFPTSTDPDIDLIVEETELRWRRLQRAERVFDIVVGFPGAAHFLSEPLIDREFLGFPIAVPEASNGGEVDGTIVDRSGAPVILHAPSRTQAKGTDHLRSIVDALKEEGLAFELDWRTEWSSRTELLARLRHVDIVLDQMYADVPVGVLSREAMASGAVAVVGSPVADWMRTRYDCTTAPVAALGTPDRISDILRQLITDPDFRADMRDAGRTTMRTVQSPEAIANRWFDTLFGDPDPSYFFDPLEIDVVIHGFAPTEHLQRVTRKLVDGRGPAALCLRHNPQLEAAVLAFAAASGEAEAAT